MARGQIRIGRESDYFAIDGEQMTSPKTCRVDFDSLAGETSGRTDDGVMHIDWIWRNIRKVSLTFPPLTTKELGELLEKVQGKEYKMTYQDPIKGENTIKAYTSKSYGDFTNGTLYNGLWVGSGFNAIELEGER